MISVYTVNKNTDIKWIKQCVEAVSRQTFKKFEYVFLDYGSDNVDEIYYMLIELLEDVSFKFVKIDKSKEFNFIDALRIAIANCEYKYILRADADDFMHHNCLKSLVMHSLENEIVFPGYYVINEDNKFVDTDAHKGILPAHALIKKSVMDKVRFMPHQKYRDGVNLELAINNNPEIRTKYINDKLFFYRKHTGSLTSNKEDVEKTDKIIRNSDESNRR